MSRGLKWLRALFKCQHDWQEIARSTVPPVANSYDLYRVAHNDRHKYLVGFTVIVSECSACKKTRRLELLGVTVAPSKPGSLHLLKKPQDGPFKK